MREAFALQKLFKIFRQKYWHIWDINIWNFNETLTNDIFSFEQPGPVKLQRIYLQRDWNFYAQPSWAYFAPSTAI